jgi:hypothetical protein
MFSTGPTTAGSQRRDRWRPELAGSGASLRSQGAVVLEGELLFAVNPGSATVSALPITAHGHVLRDTVPTNGSLPVSVPSSSLAHPWLLCCGEETNAMTATPPRREVDRSWRGVTMTVTRVDVCD